MSCSGHVTLHVQFSNLAGHGPAWLARTWAQVHPRPPDVSALAEVHASYCSTEFYPHCSHWRVNGLLFLLDSAGDMLADGYQESHCGKEFVGKAHLGATRKDEGVSIQERQLLLQATAKALQGNWEGSAARATTQESFEVSPYACFASGYGHADIH